MCPCHTTNRRFCEQSWFTANSSSFSIKVRNPRYAGSYRVTLVTHKHTHTHTHTHIHTHTPSLTCFVGDSPISAAAADDDDDGDNVFLGKVV